MNDKPVVEVLDVSAPEELPDELVHAALHRPWAGSVTDVYTLDLAGTVIARDGHARSVELVSDGVTVKEIPITFPRAAIARRFPGVPEDVPCGFRGLLGALRLGLGFELELRAVLEDGRRLPIGSLTGRRARPDVHFEPQLRPITVTALGRTGTTWLMGMLAAHPSIVVQDAPSYERWPARYWAHMLKVLCDPEDPARPARASVFDPDSPHVGPNPFYGLSEALQDELGGWLGRTYVERLASFCMHNIEDWYAIAARRQGKEQAVYFAEKNFVSRPRAAEPLLELYPDAREVFLVRDFRDMACSWVSYHGPRKLGTALGTTALLDDIMPALARRLTADWRSRREHGHLVRYEDLVFRPQETLESLLAFLEIDATGEVIDEIVRTASEQQGFEAHGTSPALEKTVGRWRHEGDEAFRDHLNDAFREPLMEFGYT